MKTFKLYFKNNITEIVKGETITQALYRAGYTGGHPNGLVRYHEI